MRDTDYATEIARGSARLASGNEARIERLYLKENQREEIRFSWWKDDRLMLRPLDVTEDELLAVLKNAIQENVFSEHFISELRTLIQSRLP